MLSRISLQLRCPCKARADNVCHIILYYIILCHIMLCYVISKISYSMSSCTVRVKRGWTACVTLSILCHIALIILYSIMNSILEEPLHCPCKAWVDSVCQSLGSPGSPISTRIVAPDSDCRIHRQSAAPPPPAGTIIRVAAPPGQYGLKTAPGPASGREPGPGTGQSVSLSESDSDPGWLYPAGPAGDSESQSLAY